MSISPSPGTPGEAKERKDEAFQSLRPFIIAKVEEMVTIVVSPFHELRAMIFFLALSILGCVLCIALHVLTYAGVGNGHAQAVATLLFMCAFVVMIAASAVHLAGPRGESKKFSFDALQKSSPRWMRWAVGIIVAYAVLNFVSFAVMEKGEPRIGTGGQLTLQRKGKLARVLSPREFRWHQGLQARGMSGHPMAFYAVSAMLFYGAMRQRRRDAVRATIPVAQAAGPTMASPAMLDYAKSSPLLPIWVHMMLFVLSFGIAWLGMPALLVTGLGRFVPKGVVVILFFGGAMGGAMLVNFLFKKAIPARCPKCLGRAYCTQFGRFPRYVCRDCGYEHKSG